MLKLFHSWQNCAFLFMIWKLYANKPADWHMWQMIMMLSICCHAIPSLTIFKQALSIRLRLIVHDFLQATNIKLPKMLRFLQCKHVALLPWKQCKSSNFSQSLTFLYRLGIERKKIVLNVEQWNNERKAVWNLSEFVKTFMITQNKGEWPTSLALTSVTDRTIIKLIVRSLL